MVYKILDKKTGSGAKASPREGKCMPGLNIIFG